MALSVCVRESARVCVCVCVHMRAHKGPQGASDTSCRNMSRDHAFSMCFLPLGQGVGRLCWWGALWVTLRWASQWPHGDLWSRSLLLPRDKGLQALASSHVWKSASQIP